MKQLLILLAFLTISKNTLVAQQEHTTLNTIQTQVTLDTLIAPDEIFIGIITTEKENKEELDHIEKEITNTLTQLGINTTEQLKIKDIGSHYDIKYLFGKDFKQRRNYELKVNTVEEAVSSIVALNKIKVGEISLSKTSYSKKDELAMELRSMAILKAKKQAEALVRPIGQVVGRATVIRDFNSLNERSNRSADGNIDQDLSSHKGIFRSTTLELKKIKIVQRLEVFFELE